jgi:hypothetical protein
MDKIDERKEKIVNFLGEQDGDPERMLKAALSTRFRELKTVERAYLVKVRYSSTGPADVALALIAAGGNDAVIRSVQETFAALFNMSQHLDIIFLKPPECGNISSLCRPFFSAKTSAAGA